MTCARNRSTRGLSIRQSRKIAPFETYENDPEETPENELLTVVHFPVK